MVVVISRWVFAFSSVFLIQQNFLDSTIWAGVRGLGRFQMSCSQTLIQAFTKGFQNKNSKENIEIFIPLEQRDLDYWLRNPVDHFSYLSNQPEILGVVVKGKGSARDRSYENAIEIATDIARMESHITLVMENYSLYPSDQKLRALVRKFLFGPASERLEIKEELKKISVPLVEENFLNETLKKEQDLSEGFVIGIGAPAFSANTRTSKKPSDFYAGAEIFNNFKLNSPSVYGLDAAAAPEYAYIEKLVGSGAHFEKDEAATQSESALSPTSISENLMKERDRVAAEREKEERRQRRLDFEHDDLDD